jgi:hypothetical protein
MRVPFDENTDRYLWTPDSYPQNSDKTYTEWTDVAIPYCSDGTNKYWTSANFKNLQWITPQQF